VLQLYDFTIESVCKYFREQLMDTIQIEADNMEDFSDAGWRQGLPWLYYETNPKTTLKKSGRFDMKMSFAKSSSFNRYKYMTFYLARYTIDGEYQGMQELKNQLSVCPMNHNDETTMQKFGTILRSECDLYLNDLISDDIAPPDETNVFYELYIADGED
jgi:hypothetical protein